MNVRRRGQPERAVKRDRRAGSPPHQRVGGGGTSVEAGPVPTRWNGAGRNGVGPRGVVRDATPQLAGWCGGSLTAEHAFLCGILTLALVVMFGYIRRGFSGNYVQTSQSHGLQFDPGRPYTDTRALGLNQEVT